MNLEPPVTADQLTKFISAAIAAKDFESVAAALKLLAFVDPAQAQAVLGTIQVAT